jgi:RNA polymerase sigma-70 factor (ECF subfamily)
MPMVADNLDEASQNDDQLMIRVQNGENAAFEAIVQRHQGPLVGFFYRSTRDWQLSEDLTQDTLVKVYNQAWDYLPLGRFRGWMFRIARNLLIDDVRRRSHDALIRACQRKPADEEDEMTRLASDVLPADVQADHQELARIVDGALSEIPDEQRQTFILHHFVDLSLPEVSMIMEVPLPTSKSRLRLAREKLSEKLRAAGITPLGSPEETPAPDSVQQVEA